MIPCPKHQIPMKLVKTAKHFILKCPINTCTIAQPLDRFGDPRGPITDLELRQLRIEAHTAFDQIWLNEYMTRDNAYLWLSKVTGIPAEKAHFGLLDKEQTKKALFYSLAYVKHINGRGSKKSAPIQDEKHSGD